MDFIAALLLLSLAYWVTHGPLHPYLYSKKPWIRILTAASIMGAAAIAFGLLSRFFPSTFPEDSPARWILIVGSLSIFEPAFAIINFKNSLWFYIPGIILLLLFIVVGFFAFFQGDRESAFKIFVAAALIPLSIGFVWVFLSFLFWLVGKGRGFWKKVEEKYPYLAPAQKRGIKNQWLRLLFFIYLMGVFPIVIAILVYYLLGIVNLGTILVSFLAGGVLASIVAYFTFGLPDLGAPEFGPKVIEVEDEQGEIRYEYEYKWPFMKRLMATFGGVGVTLIALVLVGLTLFLILFVLARIGVAVLQ